MHQRPDISAWAPDAIARLRPSQEKKDERERKGGAAAFFSKGAAPRAALPPGPFPLAGAGGSAVRGSWASLLASLIPTDAVMIAAVTLTAGLSWFLYSSVRPDAGKVRAGRAFPERQAAFQASRWDDAPEDANPGSLSYLIAANHGFSELHDAPALEKELAAALSGEEASLPRALREASLPEAAKRLPEAGGTSGARPAIKAFVELSERKGLSNLAMAGGPGLSAGMMRPFDENVTQGQLKGYRALKSPARRAMRSAASLGPSRALDQLRLANAKSRRALGSTKSEGAAYQAAQAFGGSASAAGTSVRPGGLVLGASDANPAASDPGDGGPVGTTESADDPSPPGTGKGEDKSPWTADVIAAMGLLTGASAIITAIGAMAAAKAVPVIGMAVQQEQMALLAIATGMAAAATALGVEIMTKYWQREQGAIITVGGAITTAAGIASLAAPQAVSPWVAVLGGVAGLAGVAGAALAGAMNDQ